MDKQALFERARALWPNAVILKGDVLNELYWPLSKRLSRAGDDWTDLAAWAFHQSLFELADEKARSGETVLHTAEVSFEAFDAKMRINLADDRWRKERVEYHADDE